LEECERVVEKLEKVEKEVWRLLGDIPMAQQMRSVKALGPIFIAAILSGAGDLKQYVQVAPQSPHVALTLV
jgi:transposase